MSRHPAPRRQQALVPALAERFLDALLTGDRGGAAAAVGEGLEAGLAASTLLLDVLAPAQHEIGNRWSDSRLTIAQEHHASEIVREELERVRLARPPARRLGVSAVVCTVPGEAHSLAARFVATLLACEGWEVECLGEAPPGDELVAHVALRRPRLVALSVTQAANLPHVETLCRALGDLDPRPRVMVGGQATAGLPAAAFGADLVTTDMAAGLDFAASVAEPAPPPTLAAYLAAVGRRVQAGRLAAGLTQAALAERSGLARPYIGAIESGRQNITLEAALRLAGALGLSTTELLAQELS